MLPDVECHFEFFEMVSFMALDGVTSLKDMTNTCKLMRNSPTIAGFLLCNGGKLEEAEDFKCVSSFIVCLNQNRSALVRELLSNNPLFVSQL